MFDGKSQAEKAFSDAWQQVAAGRSIESVLAGYPECAAELEPMLRLTQRVRTLSALQLSPDALARIRQRTHSILAADPVEKHLNNGVENGRTGRHPQPPGKGLPALVPLFSTVRTSRGALILLVIAAMLTSVGLVLTVAKLSSPPDSSYAVVAYSGTITHIDGAVWQVDDTQVFIDDNTEVHGQPVVGATMHCLAQPLSDNKMKAIEIWVRSAPATPVVTPGGPSGSGPPGL